MTREELREIPELAKQIARHEDRLYYLEQKAICVPAIEPKEKVQTSVVDHGNREADMAIDLTREIEEERRYLTGKQDEAEPRISRRRGSISPGRSRQTEKKNNRKML